jgi:hypothetical protein
LAWDNQYMDIEVSKGTVGSPETLSTVTCSRGMLVAFIVGEVVYSRSKGG